MQARHRNLDTLVPKSFLPYLETVLSLFRVHWGSWLKSLAENLVIVALTLDQNNKEIPTSASTSPWLSSNTCTLTGLAEKMRAVLCVWGAHTPPQRLLLPPHQTRDCKSQLPKKCYEWHDNDKPSKLRKEWNTSYNEFHIT